MFFAGVHRVFCKRNNVYNDTVREWANERLKLIEIEINKNKIGGGTQHKYAVLHSEQKLWRFNI